MKTLSLVRHAKSNWSDPGASDHQRTLNERGQRDAPMMGKRLAGHLVPDTILCSDATRAQQTANLLVPAMGLSPSLIQLEPRVYEASTQTLLALIGDVPDANQNLMMIGHNPGLECLGIGLLPGSAQKMVTAAVSIFEIETDSWSDLVGKTVRLLMHDFPKSQ